MTGHSSPSFPHDASSSAGARPGAEPENYLLQLLLGLTRKEVRFVIAGGVALVLHGHERTTMDLDIALDLSGENLERFYEAVRELRLEPRAREPLTSLGDPERVAELVRTKNAHVFALVDPDRPYRQVDIFLTPENGYDVLRADAAPVRIHGETIWIASAKRLLEMKRAIPQPRQKDEMDISMLEQILAEVTEQSD